MLLTGIPLNRRVRTDYARARLTEATYEAAVDALHPAVHEVINEEERAWLREALAEPLRLAVDAALDVLVIELGRTIEDAPASLRRKLDTSPRWRLAGWE